MVRAPSFAILISVIRVPSPPLGRTIGGVLRRFGQISRSHSGLSAIIQVTVCLRFSAPALVRAIFNLVPAPFPFSAPVERTPTSLAVLGQSLVV